MDAPAMQFLADTVRATDPAKRIVTTDREPRHVYYLQRPDGSLERTQALAAPVAHHAADLDTLVRRATAGDALRRLDDATDDGAAVYESVPEIWYARSGVVAVLTPGEPGPAKCSVALNPSPQLLKLIEWDRAGKAKVPQAELVLLLRTLFAGCCPDDFLPTIRSVQVKKKNDLEQQISQGKVSLGKSMVAEMTGASAIPERVAFNVPVFAQAAVYVQGRVRVEIDPDPANELFNLIVLPGDVEAAQAAAEEAIGNRLRHLLELLGGDAVPCYRGAP